MSYKIFHEILTHRNESLHRQAVWTEVVEHLKKFLDTDVAPAKTGIATKGEGLAVPQIIIEQIIAEIVSGPVSDCMKVLTHIDNQKVAEDVRQKTESKTEDEPAQGKGRKQRTSKGNPRAA